MSTANQVSFCARNDYAMMTQLLSRRSRTSAESEPTVSPYGAVDQIGTTLNPNRVKYHHADPWRSQ